MCGPLHFHGVTQLGHISSPVGVSESSSHAMILAIVGPFGMCSFARNRVTVEGDACHCSASLACSTLFAAHHSRIICASLMRFDVRAKRDSCEQPFLTLRIFDPFARDREVRLVDFHADELEPHADRCNARCAASHVRVQNRRWRVCLVDTPAH